MWSALRYNFYTSVSVLYMFMKLLFTIVCVSLVLTLVHAGGEIVMGYISVGAIPNILHVVMNYHCAKIGAFTMKPKIILFIILPDYKDNFRYSPSQAVCVPDHCPSA